VEEFADVAQLVEQLIRNQQVNGSSPFVGSITLQRILVNGTHVKTVYARLWRGLFLAGR
jgi:hypothetical protein